MQIISQIILQILKKSNRGACPGGQRVQRPMIGRCLLRAAHRGNRSILPHSPPALPQTSLTLPPLAQQTHPSQKEKYLVFLKSQTATTFFSPALFQRPIFCFCSLTGIAPLQARRRGENIQSTNGKTCLWGWLKFYSLQRRRLPAWAAGSHTRGQRGLLGGTFRQVENVTASVYLGTGG